MSSSLPRTQALDSPTFRPPPFENDALTLPELYDWNGANNPQHPLFLFEDGSGGISTIFWSEASQAVRRAARLISSKAGALPASAVIAVLAASDTITYMCFIIGAIRAGYTIFPISPRNSPGAVKHLLQSTNSARLWVSAEPALQSLAKVATDGLGIDILPMPVFEDIFLPHNLDCEPLSDIKLDMDAPALILHSSGSTSFPKPILRSHRAWLQLARVPWFGEVDLCGMIMGCHSMPMFHGMGVLQIGMVATCGLQMAVFKPSSPATVPTPTNVFDSSVATNTQLLACVPVFIEAWSRDPDKVAAMQKMKGVMYGGGPLNKEVGDYLASKGVSIYVTFGSTECGVMSTFLRENPGSDWEYFTFSDHTRPEIRPFWDGAVECVMTSHETHQPCVFNTKVQGRDAYATSDLLLPHPTKAALWKVFGRADDQIMLSTGEKTNPVPLEAILCQDPHVQSAVIFGRGQFQNGVIVDPKKEFVFDPADESPLIKFRNSIWPTVERLNDHAPTHSRIFKEMILVSSPSKPFTYTAKGTARRQAVIADYEDEINAMYTTVAKSTSEDIAAPEDWTHPLTLDFIRKTVSRVLNSSVDDGVDLFQHGCDSLQATWIRNSIIRAVRQTANSSMANNIPDNVVYLFPSVMGLATFVSQAVTTGTAAKCSNVPDKLHEFQRLIEEYSANFPAHTPALAPEVAAHQGQGDVVLLTGTTGGFGCNLLAQLAASNAVSRVYAVNRPSSGDRPLHLRQRDALELGGHDQNILGLAKIQLVEADLSLSGLDILPMRSSVTHIIHNAWRVDFNLSLSSFGSNIRSLRNLVNLALLSSRPDPPRLIFVGSVGVLRNISTNIPAAEVPILDPEVVIGSGYTESKWVGERILTAAAETTPLRPIIIRLGQLTGDNNGFWNEREWFPAVVKSGVTMKCLPNIDGPISWITSSDAAAAIVDMRNSDASILHLVHPQPASWSSVMEPIARKLGATLVPFLEWISSLEKCLLDTSLTEVEHMRENPALALLDFFRQVDLSSGREPMGIPRLETREAVRVSPTLRKGLKQLGEDDALKWLEGWKRREFI